jgi:ribosomal protein L32
MGLPGHRRTSSHKRRRASHFALTKPSLTVSPTTGTVHLSHRAAPGATEYNGHPIHVKGRDKKLEKLLGKAKKPAKEADDHHDHEGHTHA